MTMNLTSHLRDPERKEYQRAYYAANKARLKEKRKKQPRTSATVASEARYREKKRLLGEIEKMPHGPVWGDRMQGVDEFFGVLE